MSACAEPPSSAKVDCRRMQTGSSSEDDARITSNLRAGFGGLLSFANPATNG